MLGHVKNLYVLLTLLFACSTAFSRILPDIPYTVVPADTNQHLDIYIPDFIEDKQPAVVFFHSGGFYGGSRKGQMVYYLDSLYAHGFVVVSAGYRVGASGAFPYAVHDAQTSIRFLKSNADRFFIDSSRIGVLGASAGGYLAAMIAVAHHVDSLQGDELGYSEVSSEVVSATLMFPVTQFHDWDQLYDARCEQHNSSYNSLISFVGCVPQICLQRSRNLAPQAFLDKPTQTELLTLHGNLDCIIPAGTTLLFHQALISAGTQATLQLQPDYSHNDDVRWFQGEIKQSVQQFFSRTLRKYQKNCPGHTPSPFTPLAESKQHYFSSDESFHTVTSVQKAIDSLLVQPLTDSSSLQRPITIAIIARPMLQKALEQFTHAIDIATRENKINQHVQFITLSTDAPVEFLSDSLWVDTTAKAQWQDVLHGEGISIAEVDAVWYFPFSQQSTPVDTSQIQLEQLAHNITRATRQLSAVFDNSKGVFLSDRPYRGFDQHQAFTNHDEPGYALTLAIRRAIISQLDIPSPRPWAIAWGPWMWHNGTSASPLGFYTECSDYNDGIFLNASAAQRLGAYMLSFWQTSDLSFPWIVSHPTVRPTASALLNIPSTNTVGKQRFFDLQGRVVRTQQSLATPPGLIIKQQQGSIRFILPGLY